MMVDVSMFIGKAPLIDATGNYGAVAQFKDASGLFVGRRAVSECSKVGPVGTARYGGGTFFCGFSLRDMFWGPNANAPGPLWGFG